MGHDSNPILIVLVHSGSDTASFANFVTHGGVPRIVPASVVDVTAATAASLFNSTASVCVAVQLHNFWLL
jgi:hypothetical protein